MAFAIALLFIGKSAQICVISLKKVSEFCKILYIIFLHFMVQ